MGKWVGPTHGFESAGKYMATAVCLFMTIAAVLLVVANITLEELMWGSEVAIIAALVLCNTLNKIGGHAKHRQCGSFFCKCAFPFLHLGKPKPSARIARVCIACMGDKDVVIRHLTPEFFHALEVIGPCKVELPDSEHLELVRSMSRQASVEVSTP